MKKIIVTTLIAGSVLLAGCSSNTHQKLDQLSTDVQILNQKVDTLQTDVNQVRHDVDRANSEADRANQRLNNQVQMYRK